MALVAKSNEVKGNSMEEIREITLDKLLLDEQNPRLPDWARADQASMLDYIARNTSVEELMQAISTNGFFLGEPIIVTPSKDGKFVVVEGNRRLCAVMLLTNPELLPGRRRVSGIAEKAAHKPASLPCVIYSDRGDVLTYLGNRHIAGVKQWEPLPKARYMKRLFDEITDADESFEDRCRAVARSIGSRWDYIAKNITGYQLVWKFEKNAFYGHSDITEDSLEFSVLTTSFDYPQIREYLELGEISGGNFTKINDEHLQHLFEWLFVRNEEYNTTRIGDSRNLSKLAHFILIPKAVEEFSRGGRLEFVFKRYGGREEEFEQRLQSIENEIRDVWADAPEIDPSDSIGEIVDNISRYAVKLAGIFPKRHG